MSSQLRHRASAKAPAVPSRPLGATPAPRAGSKLLGPLSAAVLAGCSILAGWFYFASSPPSAKPSTAVAPRFNGYPSPASWDDARSEVAQAIQESYRAYANSDAWGCDDFFPESGTGGNLTSGGSIGYFIVDVLDTLLLTPGMEADYAKAKAYVRDELTFDVDGKFNAFETTIRVLGGLLSAYHLDGEDPMYLEKALDLGSRLLPIFKTPTGVPLSFINLKTGQAFADADNNGFSSLAEATTLQLELKYLAEISQEPIYWDVAEKVMMSIRKAYSLDGLLPILVHPDNLQFFYHIRLGSRGDSYYEYLIKQYLQTGRTETVYKEMYDDAMAGVKEHLVKETSGGSVYTGELHPQQTQQGGQSYGFVPKQDHLVCFLGGSLLLGVTEGQSPLSDAEVAELGEAQEQDWTIGKELIKTCVDTYQGTETGLGPEIVHFKAGQEDWKEERDWRIPGYVRGAPPLDARNILRPETVESLFLAWRTTRNPIYREWGWQIFKAFQEHCRLPTNGAYASIRDVNELPPDRENRMETFWLSETLKYLLLLFSDDSVIPLDQYVFNTEAHIFPVFDPTVVDLSTRTYA